MKINLWHLVQSELPWKTLTKRTPWRTNDANEEPPPEHRAKCRENLKCTSCYAVFCALLLAVAGLDFYFTEGSAFHLQSISSKHLKIPNIWPSNVVQEPDLRGTDITSPKSTNMLQCRYKHLLNKSLSTTRNNSGPFPWIQKVMQTASSVMFSFESRGPLSGFNYEVKHYACDGQRGYAVNTVVCNLTLEHFSVRLVSHPAHFFQVITPCWSAFAEFPNALRKVSVDDMVRGQLEASAWPNTLLGAMNAEVINLGKLKQLEQKFCGRVAVISPPKPESGWKIHDNYNLPFVKQSDALSFRGLLINRRARDPGQDKPGLRLGILNRRGKRELLHTDKLVAFITENKDYSCINVTETHNLGALSHQEQAQWVYTKDIIISPHGQQLMNLAFMNTCAVVLEVYPHNYVIPGFFLPFAVNLGAVAFGMHNGPGMVQNGFLSKSKWMRSKLRAARISAISDLQKALPYLLEARASCCRRLRAISILEASMARCL